MLQLNKIIFAFLLAGTLPGADKKMYAFLSASTLPVAAQKNKICVLFSGYFACCEQNKSYMRFFHRYFACCGQNKGVFCLILFFSQVHPVN